MLPAVYFLKEKVVVQEKDKDGKITKRKTNDAYQQVKMDKIILLQNDKTASASEALNWGL